MKHSITFPCITNTLRIGTQRIEEEPHWLATAVHDLRHPASAILLYSELLIEDAATTLTDEQKEMLQSIHSSCELMLHMLRDVADFADPETMSLESTDLRYLMEECISLSRPGALCKGVKLVLRNDELLPEIMVDREKLQQVLMHLIEHAIYSSQNDHGVEVGARLDHDQVLIWVRDNGPDILPDEIDKLFTPFQKTRARTAEPGWGLRLSVCKHIVEGHGGRIWAESAFGEGAVVYLTLPFQE